MTTTQRRGSGGSEAISLTGSERNGDISTVSCILTPMRSALSLIVLTLSSAALNPAGTQQRADSSCPVTIGRKSPISPKWFFGSSSAHWNGNLYVGGLWPNGTIVFHPGGAGFVHPDGSVAMKIAWYRAKGLRGPLTITGKRLDGIGPLVRAEIPNGYHDTGFQPSEVIFPSEGCWQVTGTVADASVTFVTRVVKMPGLKPNVNEN